MRPASPARVRAPLLYRLLTPLSRPLVRMLFRPSIQGVEHVPVAGFVLSSNHLSGFDSIALAYAIYPRAFRSMAKVQLFERPLLGPFVRALGAFPARSGNDPDGAVATASRLAQAGHPVVIFPAGARRRKDRDHRPRTGAARAAILGGVPLIPAALRGTDRWRRFGRWYLAFGPAVHVADLAADDAYAAREATHRLWDAIAELQASLDHEAVSGTTAGRTESGSS